jgi:TDG/mug DNA glycosylase family protein
MPTLSERFSYTPADAEERSIESRPVPAVVRRGGHPSELLYAHLSPLPDLLVADLRLVFVGFNPGIRSAEVGHRFAHHTNSFWKLLNESGLVDVALTFMDDVRMPESHGIGFTELVMRPTRGIEEVPPHEMRSNVPRLLAVLKQYRPKVVCFVGKGIWDSVSKASGVRSQRSKKKFEWGLQQQSFYKGKIFVVPSTSGLVRISWEEKLKIWIQLAEIVEEA